jgi:hypothetical protein
MDLHKYIHDNKLFHGYDEYESKIREELLRDTKLMYQLEKCIQFGVKKDIEDLITSTFNIPLGIKWKLISLFTSFQGNLHIENNVNILECEDQSTHNEAYAINLFRKLMNGTELCDIFETLKSDLRDKIINNSSYLKYEQLFLDIGGHQSSKSTHASFDAMRRFRISIENLKTVEIKSINTSTNGEFAYIHEKNQYYMIHQSGKIDTIPTNQMQLCESGKLWWKFEKCAQDVVYSRDYFPLSSSISLANVSIRPYLVIGDSISLKVVQPDIEELLTITLDVNRVISVDCHTTADDIVSSVVLLEGRISNAHGGFGYHDEDGKSELGDDSSLSQYSTDDEDDPRYFLPALAAVKARYYVCFCLCHQTITSITNVVAVNNLVLDQVPTAIKMLTDSTAIVYGTNALLSKVVKGENFIFSDVLNDYDDSSIYNSNIFNIVSDDSNMPLMYHSTASQVSHEFNAHITAVSYTKDENTLVSGDSCGSICFWSLTNKNHSILLYPRLQLITECRIMDINIASTGKHCCVALYDRLILLGVTSNDKELYIRASLDIIEGYRMFYRTTFLHDTIQIWRFIADPYSNSTVATGWKHKNIDQFKSRRIDVKDICRMAVDFRSTNNTATIMELENDSEVSVGAADGGCTQYSVQTFRQHLFSSESSKNILKEFMTGNTSTYGDEQSDDELSPSTLAPFSADTSTIEMTTDGGMSENSLYFMHQQFNQEMEANYMALMTTIFVHDRSIEYIRAFSILSILSVAQTNPVPLGLIAAVLDLECINVYNILSTEKFLNIVSVVYVASTSAVETESYVISPNAKCPSLFRWLSSKLRAGREFYIDETVGHSYLCSMYLKYCSNKSVAVGKRRLCTYKYSIS